MIYFEKNDGNILKWDITYDEEDLKSIREELIDKFSEANSYPRLVILIDKLLEKDFSVLIEIESPIETKEDEYERIISSFDEEIDSIDNFDVDRKIRKLEQLKKIISESELNKKQNPISKYYEMTRSVINMCFVDCLESSEIERFEDFFDIDVKEIVKIKK